MLARRALSRRAVDRSSMLLRNAPAISASSSLWRARALALYASRSMATTVSAHKPAAKKTASATTAPKAAAKTKTAAKKPASTKVVAKKPAAKTKRVVKKATQKKTVKKELSEEQKEVLEKQKQRSMIQALRKKALKPPHKNHRLSGYVVFVMKNCSKSADPSQTPLELKDAGKAYRELTPSQLQDYKQMAVEVNAARKIEYSEWVNSHSPEQIRLANNARRALRRKLKGVYKGVPSNTEKIPDSRLPKHPSPPFFYYIAERQQTDDFKGSTVAVASKRCSEEWRAMGPEQRKKYVDMSDAARLAKAKA